MEGYEFREIDEELYAECLKEYWAEDFVCNYGSYQNFSEKGLGIVALKDGKIVAGASSYSSYRQGIEIEIDTAEEYRRRGLATACASRLILRCIEKGLTPSWDAHNLISAALAEKLGFERSFDYEAYIIRQ